MAYKIKKSKTLKNRPRGVRPTIKTAWGTAYYVRTDVEDNQENWRGKNLSTKDGYFAIHEGIKHHIYQI